MWLLCLCIAAVSAFSPPPADVDAKIDKLEYQPHENRAATTFNHKYVTHNGGINDHKFPNTVTISATSQVASNALYKAALVVSYMVRNMPDEVFQGVANTMGVGIFSKSEGLTIYPENSNVRDRPSCRGTCRGSCWNTCTIDGRKYITLAGYTSLSGRSVVLDLNVICDPTDIYRRQDSLMVHEFAHLVMLHMTQHWQDKIKAAYANAKRNRLWTLTDYAMIDANEYWAIASSSFFHATTRLDVDGGMDLCGTRHACPDEMAARAYIKQHDPMVYEALVYAYTNNRPNLRSGLSPCV